MRIEDFLKLQENNIRELFCNDMSQCLIAIAVEKIEQLSRDYQWNISFLSHTDHKKVLIITKKNDSFPEIWVSSTYTRYRLAFINYLKKFFLIDRIPDTLQVDHIFPRNYFKKKYSNYFIRLHLLDRKSNHSFGASWEKLITNNKKNEPNGGYHLDYISLAKLFGYKLPGLNASQSERERWAINFSIVIENKWKEKRDINFPGILSVLNRGYANLNLHKVITTSVGMYNLSYDIVF